MAVIRAAIAKAKAMAERSKILFAFIKSCLLKENRGRILIINYW